MIDMIFESDIDRVTFAAFSPFVPDLEDYDFEPLNDCCD